MDIASEYRYRNPVVGPGDLVDRHHAVGRDGRHARRDAAGARARREGRWRSPTSWARRRRATPTACCSRAPASRSASRPPRPSSPRSRRCTCSRCASPSCAARCDRERLRELVAELKRIPHCIEELLGDGRRRPSSAIAAAHHDAEFFLYLGRHVGLPVCARGRAQAQGDLLHRHRRLRGRRDEARPDRAARRGHAGRRASPPTRRCSTRSSRTCRRSAPAART